jgi:glutaredoxin
MAAPPSVRMYSRRACHLCDAARATIESVRQRVPFRFEEVFIDGNDDLERAYGLRVPVVVVDGREAFEYEVDAAALRRLVGPARDGRRGAPVREGGLGPPARLHRR